MKAFPEVKYIKSGEFGSHVMAIEGGMDLRDYFAAKAMQALLSLKDLHDSIANEKVCPLKVPKAAYEWADAMMAAREAK